MTIMNKLWIIIAVNGRELVANASVNLFAVDVADGRWVLRGAANSSVGIARFSAL